MQYIKEQDAFERWLETNHLPTTAQLIWYKLFLLCNRAFWPEWFAVDNQRLMAMAKIPPSSEKTFITHRDRLIDAGLIEHRRGKKGSPNKYKMRSFLEGEAGKSPKPKTPNNNLPPIVTEIINTGNKPVNNNCTGNKPVDSTVQMTVQTTTIIDKDKDKDLNIYGDVYGECENEEFLKELDRYFGMNASVKTELAKFTTVVIHRYMGRKATGQDMIFMFQYIYNSQRDEDGEWVMDLPENKKELVHCAFEAAALAGQLNWRYIKGIYSNFIRRGIKNKDEAEAYEAERELGIIL